MIEKPPKGSLIWDLPLRLFHWALLAAVTTSIVAAKVLDDIDLHVQSGQIVLGLLVFRLIWGICGSTSAQFHRFIRGPRTILRYLRGESVPYVGHNPLGALSVIAMLASLSVQAITGLGTDDEIFTTGPLNQFLTEEQVAWANQIHEWNQYLLFALIAVHIGAILFYQFKKRDNLIGPMITGRLSKNAPAQPNIRVRPIWLVLVVVGISIFSAIVVFSFDS